MDYQRELRIQDIAEEILSLAAEERQRYMHTLMVKDPALAMEVQELLGHSLEVEEAEQRLHHDPMLGKQLNAYYLQRLLGAGGMGRVYLAEQKGPIKRQVAVKIVGNQGLDEELFQRFKIEQQMLANLSHPHIAKLYESGVTEEGVPFFAMEYIDGLPIVQYCQAHDLSLKARIELFLQVCDAIVHAHFKGVIHRDLKPSNIMVYQEDGRAIVKVIDFGISKPITASMTLTRTGSQMGSLPYMSPEQAGYVDHQGKPLDIDLRSDIYSLGVVLYQVLVGVLPLSWTENTSFRQMLQDICERQPMKPSTCLLQLQNQADLSLESARTQVTWQDMRHDLDWVVMKALQKDREQRYASVTQFRDDLRAYLDGFPVSAGPPHWFYTTRKFFLRHKLQVAIVALFFLAAILVPTSYSLATKRQQAETIRERDRAEHVVQFLVDLFRIADPNGEGRKDLTAKEMLDMGARDLRAKLDEEPAVRARMLLTIGKVYHNMGFYDEAEELSREGLALREQFENTSAEELLSGRVLLAEVLNSKGRYSEALPLLEESLAAAPLADDQPQVLKGKYVLASILNNLADYHKAEAVVDDLVQSYGSNPEAYNDYSRALLRQAVLRLNLGKYEAARDSVQLILKTLRDKGDANISALAGAIAVRGIYHAQMGNATEAERDYREADAIMVERLGVEHQLTIKNRHNLAIVLESQRKYGQARATMYEVLDAIRLRKDVDQLTIASMLSRVAFVEFMTGNPERAIQLGEESLELFTLEFDNQYHIEVGRCHFGLAKFYLWLDQFEVAQTHARLGLEHYKNYSEINAISIAEARMILAETHLAIGDYHQAKELKDLAIACLEQTLPVDHPLFIKADWIEGQYQLWQGEDMLAESLLVGVYDRVKSRQCELELYEGRTLQVLVALKERQADAREAAYYQDLVARWETGYAQKIQRWQEQW